MALDVNGFTVLNITVGVSRTIYVSSSTGSDANDGLSVGSPKATIAAGYALLRDGFPDWILLKRGDTFALTADQRTSKVGLSESEKQVWTAYGEGERPIITRRLWYGEGVKSCDHLAITDIHFYEPRNDPDSPAYLGGAITRFGLQILASSSDDLLIENCKFSYCSSQLQIQGTAGSRMNNVTVRRNIFYRGTEFGALINQTDNLLCEENIFDQNGWLRRTVQLHNLYLKETAYANVRNNMFSRGGAMGLKFSSDYVDGAVDFNIENNCFWRCWVGLGHSAGPQYNALVDFSHKRGVVYNNTFEKVGKTIPYNSTNTQAIGMNIGNCFDCRFEANIFAHNDEILSGGAIFNFSLSGTERNENITAIDNVVWNWLSTRYNQDGVYMQDPGGVINFVQINNLPEVDVNYSDPSRSLLTYAQSIGLASSDEEAFMSNACAMDRTTWDDRYSANAVNSYIRIGFGLQTASTTFLKLRVGGSKFLIIRKQAPA